MCEVAIALRKPKNAPHARTSQLSKKWVCMCTSQIATAHRKSQLAIAHRKSQLVIAHRKSNYLLKENIGYFLLLFLFLFLISGSLMHCVSALKTFRLQDATKKVKQHRPIPNWIRILTGNNVMTFKNLLNVIFLFLYKQARYK